MFLLNRSWSKLIIAYGITSLGDELTKVALLAKIYEIGGSVDDLALLMIFQIGPSMFISPFVGSLTAKISSKTLLFFSDIARCLLLLLILFADDVWLIFCLSAIASMFSYIFYPVEADFEPQLLREDEMLKANSIRTSVRQIMFIAGPALAGLLLLYFSASSVLIFDVLSFLLSGIIILFISSGKKADTQKETKRANHFQTGLRFILAQKEMRLLFLIQFVLTLLLGFQGPLFFEFVHENLHLEADGYGVLMTFLGIGILIASFIMQRQILSQARLFQLIAWVLLIDAVALILFSYGTSLLYCGLFMVIIGFISACYQIISRTILQMFPPEKIRIDVIGIFYGAYGPTTMLALGLIPALISFGPIDQILRGAGILELGTAVICLVLISPLGTFIDKKNGN